MNLWTVFFLVGAVLWAVEAVEVAFFGKALGRIDSILLTAGASVLLAFQAIAEAS